MGRLGEIAKVFFKLGCIAFGGPAAHIAMMEAEIVEKRKWITREHFLDLIGATNLIPGPNSTEMTMHCGYERGGWAGLFIAGFSFIFPAVVLTGILGWIYVTYGSLPEVEPFFTGIKPAVLVIIVGAVLKLGKKAIKTSELIAFGLFVIALSFLGVNEVIALLGTGLLGMIYFSVKDSSKGKLTGFLPVLMINSKLLTVFFTFLKVGAVLYGSGYVLFAYLDAELVERGLMTRQELMDAIAVGQFTPGPVLSTATFVGYQLSGFWGAILATLGIFLPSFLFVLLLNPLIPRMRKWKPLSYFLDTVNVAAVGIMVAVLINMSIETLIDWRMIVIAVISTVLFISVKKINMVWLVLLGAVLGYGLNLI